MTFVALITTETSLPSASPNSSADLFVITETISSPPDSSTTTITTPCLHHT